MKRIFLYGMTGAEDQYRVARYFCIDQRDLSIENIIYSAQMMKIKNPSIERVYAMDDRYGLRRDYMESIKKNSIESCAIFKDILEREGLRVI